MEPGIPQNDLMSPWLHRVASRTSFFDDFWRLWVTLGSLWGPWAVLGGLWAELGRPLGDTGTHCGATWVPKASLGLHFGTYFDSFARFFGGCGWKVGPLRNMHRHERIACMRPLLDPLLTFFWTFWPVHGPGGPKDTKKPPGETQERPKRPPRETKRATRRPLWVHLDLLGGILG